MSDTFIDTWTPLGPWEQMRRLTSAAEGDNGDWQSYRRGSLKLLIEIAQMEMEKAEIIYRSYYAQREKEWDTK